jgi:hypothetical protein
MTVITDTSVVLNLCWLGMDSLLARFFERVLAPGEVPVAGSIAGRSKVQGERSFAGGNRLNYL